MPVKVILITGNELRHRYMAHQCAEDFDLLKVYFETKANLHEKFEIQPSERMLMDKHFALRHESEKNFFGRYDDLSALNYSSIDTGESNTPEIVEEIIRLAPDYILLFGSSLIKSALLSAFPNRVINLHLGLSPYYRGSGTNFWPLVHNKPECVGATIHIATEVVDAGAILQQVRPDVSIHDSVHDMGNKTIIAAVAVLPEIVTLYDKDEIGLLAQEDSDGVLCKRKDLTASAISILYDNFENGMLEKYLSEQQVRNDAYPIVQQMQIEK